jgi:hypothetical protein
MLDGSLGGKSDDVRHGLGELLLGRVTAAPGA